jgi:hypothetical protein
MTHETGEIFISWTQERLTQLKLRIAAAEAENKEVINVQGYPVLLTYGKKLAADLTSQFNAMAERKVKD